MSTNNSSPLLIVGTGAMACLFAARLSNSGYAVTLLGSWQDGLDALSQYGVRLVESDGSETAYKVNVARDPKQCRNVRYALVLVKSWGTAHAAQQLHECLHPDGLAITLQNGIGNRLTLACRLGEERTALGITTYGASLLGPGRVRPGGDGQIVLTNPQVTRPVGSVLEGAGFEVEYTDDASALQWAKLLINAAINPLTALLDVTNGELLQRPSARALMTASALETATVASVMDIQMPFANPVAAVEEVAHRTAANRSSMLQDIQRSAPTEIDAINGAIVKAGKESGVPTPVNRTLWLLIKAKQGEPGNKRKV